MPPWEQTAAPRTRGSAPRPPVLGVGPHGETGASKKEVSVGPDGGSSSSEAGPLRGRQDTHLHGGRPGEATARGRPAVCTLRRAALLMP